MGLRHRGGATQSQATNFRRMGTITTFVVLLILVSRKAPSPRESQPLNNTVKASAPKPTGAVLVVETERAKRQRGTETVADTRPKHARSEIFVDAQARNRWYCSRDEGSVAAQWFDSDHKSNLRVLSPEPLHKAARALHAAFAKGWLLKESCVDADLPCGGSPAIQLGMLIVEADFGIWLEIIGDWTAPLAGLTLVLNTNATRAVQGVTAIVGALADLGHPVTLVHAPSNIGVAAGWNAILENMGWNLLDREGRETSSYVRFGRQQVSDVEKKPSWVFIVNSDFFVPCVTVRTFFTATTQRFRQGSWQSVITSAQNTSQSDAPVKVASRLSHVSDFDNCERATIGLVRVAKPTDDVAAPIAVHHLVHWAAFVIFRQAVERVGPFDANIWPAYGEDIEYCLRLRADGAMTRTFFVMPPTAELILDSHATCSVSPHLCGVVHRPSTVLSRAGAAFRGAMKRWARGEYAWQKWGFDRRNTATAILPHYCPHAFPYAISGLSLSAGASGGVDPKHLECVRFGSIRTYPDDTKCKGMCIFDPWRLMNHTRGIRNTRQSCRGVPNH